MRRFAYTLLGVVVTSCPAVTYASCEVAVFKHGTEAHKGMLHVAWVEKELDGAKATMSQVEAALVDAANAARECKCVSASDHFLTASRNSTRSVEAANSTEFFAHFRTVEKDYNRGAAVWKACDIGK